MRALPWLLLVCLGFATPAWAFAPADSAAVARAAWRAATEARLEGDKIGALRQALRAHEVWPMQWYYGWGLASIAAEAREPTTTARALDDLAALGIGMDVAQDSAIAASAARDLIVSEAANRLRANLAPMVGSIPRAEFPAADSAFWPEGLAWDGKTGRFFVASVRQHKVVAVGTDGVPHDFVSTGTLAALAVGVDGPRRTLWVTSAGIAQAGPLADADKGRALLEGYDIDTGKLLVRHPFPPSAAGHVPGDVCIGPDGEVFVSDSASNTIYRLSLGLRFEEWLSDPSFRSLQGQAFSPGPRTLYVADYSHGIAAVDVATREVTWLDPPPGQTILGIDGMAITHQDIIYAVQNGISPPRIVKLALGNSVPRRPVDRVARLDVVDRNVPEADEPTMGALTKDAYVYVANSQWEKYDDEGVRVPGTVLTPPRLLSVPLKKGKPK